MASTPPDTPPTLPAAEARPSDPTRSPIPDEGIPVPPPPPPPPPKPVTWPAWFAATDGVLAVMVGALAFLAASYAVRNSDFWFHLANGRLIASGQFTPGSDPFSHAGEAGRPWVNWSWLTDLAMYAVYSADPSGAAVVVAKAALVAVAFGLLFLLRRPGHALWPWAVLAGAAVVASAPFLSARPYVVSLMFLSATLVILYRGAWAGGSWRWPLILAGLFVVWANSDVWFFLGPVTVALVLLGEVLHPWLLGPDPAADAGDAAFSPNPPVPQLVRALLLGIAACALNPSFLAAVAQDPSEAIAQALPPELGFGVPPGAAADLDLSILTFSPLEGRAYLGINDEPQLFGWAFVALTAGGGLALALGYHRLRAPHIVLWVGFAAMAFQHVRLIPFFAVVAVPLTAAHLNGLSARLALGPWADPRTRLLLIGSGLGRILSVVAAALAVGATYPGWLHPTPQPMAWELDPDAGLVRAARLVGGWDESGRLPDGHRMLNVSPDFGDFVAWYAPGERVFVNSRTGFHRGDLPDLLDVRRVVVGRRGGPGDGPPDLDVIGDVAERHRSDYLAVTTRAGRILNVQIPLTLAYDTDRWALWHLDGRSAVVGRRSAAEALRFDPAALAFGPGGDPVPAAEVTPAPPADRGFVEEYLHRPAPVPPGADDAEVWAQYANVLAQVTNVRRQQELQLQLLGRSAAVGPAAAYLAKPPRQPVADDQLAIPVLMVRAARRAVAAAPDRPEGYRALSIAYQHPLVPVSSEQDQRSQVVTAQTRFLARLPEPARASPAVAFTAAEEARKLADALYNSGQLDFARDAIRTAAAYTEVAPAELFAVRAGGRGASDNPKAQLLTELAKVEQRLADQVAGTKNRLQAVADPAQRFFAAAQGGLPGDAIDQFKSAANPNDVYGGNAMGVALMMVQLELNAGRLEDATDDLLAIQEDVEKMSDGGRRDPASQVVAGQVKQLRALAARLTGDTATALELESERVGAALPKLTPSQLAPLQQDLALPPFGLGAAAGPVPLLPLRLTPALLAAEPLRQEASFNIDRGMLALEAGDMAKARAWFEQSKAPQGVALARLLTPAHRSLLLTSQAIAAGPGLPPQQLQAIQQQTAAKFDELAQTADLAERYAGLIRKYQR